MTGLASPGEIRLEPGRLALSGQRPRTALASGVAGAVALFLVVASVMLLVLGGSAGHHLSFTDLKLVVAVGAAVAVGGFLGLRSSPVPRSAAIPVVQIGSRWLVSNGLGGGIVSPV